MMTDQGERLVFRKEYRNFAVEAYWREPPGSEARIVVYRDDEIYREFGYPAYRVFNIAAHFQEMVEHELARPCEPAGRQLWLEEVGV